MAIRDQRLRGQFWRATLNGWPQPASGEFDRPDLARRADSLMIIDAPGDIDDFRIRRLGAGLATQFGTLGSAPAPRP